MAPLAWLLFGLRIKEKQPSFILGNNLIYKIVLYSSQNHILSDVCVSHQRWNIWGSISRKSCACPTDHGLLSKHVLWIGAQCQLSAEVKFRRSLSWFTFSTVDTTLAHHTFHHLQWKNHHASHHFFIVVYTYFLRRLPLQEEEVLRKFPWWWIWISLCQIKTDQYEKIVDDTIVNIYG